MSLPVVDLHSDLLSYLVHKEGRVPSDAASRNSFCQMQEGKVAIQTLAIFARTKEDSVTQGAQQINHFLHLLSKYPNQCAPLSSHRALTSDCVQFIAAIENASAFASET